MLLVSTDAGSAGRNSPIQETTMTTCHVYQGMLINYLTGEEIRAATQSEIAEASDAPKVDAQGRRTIQVELDGRFDELLSACSDLDHGDGTLGIVIRQALADDPGATAADIRQIWRDATEEHAANVALDVPEVSP